ncbi:TPA: vitamin B12 ABC transporter substrate-binding protein BtuF [Vibrio cholerae]|uniref:vitamin B12 ABC transporter substrate-binding protein BtuF n=1 Tax=Vibrio cholerae TaxID=666 RepID=UPI0004E2B024|nr:vitamin B12 ABC transporter substrate-binding protein BtuF [Vibrio cholerae]EGR2414387.1 vitamin B12 ABC transporter substrate-binding protein BtuF [Vibrio cholerae]EGR2473532.1 vitamin B12 ABC transporter substrate-binding protein BtuF [Vibrio cholerae]KFD84861.1 periplasmic binding family protein [Vibrio cholerae]MCX9598016.1 vitamin B12 ABC transporter substrate-binding protein BtuF [Vibrio cholerae]MDV2310204.1 vitamin B12 ABC transporter substrate-binding protein BtuF [Vibrio cholerae]
MLVIRLIACTFLFITPNLLAKPFPAERIISLAPHATEIAYAAGLGDKLVAVSEYSDYPPQALELERVANHQTINIEKILTLKPDLIIAWPAGNPPRELAKLRQLGFTIYDSQTKTLDEIADNIEALSHYSANPEVGQKAAHDFRQRLQDLRTQYASNQPIRYFYQLSEKPIITLAQGHWPSEVFSLCGGVNIFADSEVPYPQVSIEQVLVKQPQVIFTSEHAIANGHMWRAWQAELNAVQNDQVWALNADWLNRPTPRTLDAVEQVCTYLKIAQKQ